ncbi:hypothetical protein L837_0011 [Mycobacterium avium MAV_061107_1842]|uniref:Uncharacterized protein n=1 Tax=Mycobacterium avium (strain 104) TaxID=243243 RepID=A0A0H3A3L8_MYCA1|nr:hypothetical protein MAV_5038 [Mycobacterium avium 104]ETZ49257.1 hypothetical protein L837_0011 [Mycobacterium avium MAV_061107_1842]
MGTLDLGPRIEAAARRWGARRPQGAVRYSGPTRQPPAECRTE